MHANGPNINIETHHLTFYFLVKSDFPDSSVGKESTCNAGDLDLIPGLGRSPGEGKGYPLQYSGLENSMNCIVHGVAKSWTRLSDFHHSPSWWHVSFCSGVDFAVLGNLSVVVG